MTDEILAEQVDYYRRRASEYDATAYGDPTVAGTRIARLVGDMQVTGRVLEIACGTGLWTQALAESAESVTAIDSSPEVVELARARVSSATVSFEVADVFSWRSTDRFDVIFFSAWLSHVPAERLDEFWSGLRELLAEDGRVLFIDEHVDEQAKENYLDGQPEIIERQLQDGSTFRIVKNFVEPRQLEGQLRTLGWECTIRRDGTDWVIGEARPHPGAADE